MLLAGLSCYYRRRNKRWRFKSTFNASYRICLSAKKNNPTFLRTHIRKVKVCREEVLMHQHTQWTKQLFGLLKVWTAGAFRHKNSAEHPHRRCSKSCLDQNQIHFHSCPVSPTDPTSERSPVNKFKEGWESGTLHTQRPEPDCKIKLTFALRPKIYTADGVVLLKTNRIFSLCGPQCFKNILSVDKEKPVPHNLH